MSPGRNEHSATLHCGISAGAFLSPNHRGKEMNRVQTVAWRNDNDRFEVGQKIRDRRLELGLSQDELANRIGTSRNYISRHENGQHDMSICTLFQYAEALESNPQLLCPDRFKQNHISERFLPIIKTLSQLSDESLRTIQAMAERLQQLETRT